MRRILLRLLTAGVVVAIALAAVGLHHARNLLEPVAAQPGGEPATRLFVVERGQGLGAVARRLEDEGLIRDARVAVLAARWEGIEKRLQVGEYELSPAQSSLEILRTLTSGRVKTWPVTLPEGSRASEIAQRLEEAGLASAVGFLAVAQDPAFAASLGIEADGLEGYLYPDTYHLPRNMAPEEVARTLVRQFENVWASEIEPLAVGHALSKHELVTLASIVEKETAAADERPLIAAVFLNRLERGMRLETDPTVIYGIPDFDGNIKKRHLLDASNPYNTYRIAGLPPGPIASPGVEALRAVVRPADSDYLYFVSRNDGTHEFSATYREHVNAVNHYQKRRRSR